ncbi:hypothetical protein [Paenibacillus sp. N3.4]|uniref:hypothetical protein n=1 Tax=Paenibacillus sp. N3.4 TaxID=2603222 RepID=UPI0011CA274B|nr:hypothetical protein [Paenibacillus sp. N3.4]TXK84905.1 hypothetical protein FU659_06395 [Paenibacillus sp. N3.4]
MRLFMNSFPIRFEQGYELGYGPSVYDMMAEFILAFPNLNEDVLFTYTNWNKDLDTLEDFILEESAESFHFDLIYDPEHKIGNKVKRILLNHYAPECDPKVDVELMDQLMTNFKAASLNELDEELVRVIGKAVHGMQSIYTLEDRDELTQYFVNSRLVDINSSWLWSYEKPDHFKNILWYRANSKDDILQSFNLTSWWFSCAIVNSNTTVENYSYFLDYTEEHGEEHDGMVLYITTSNKGHFKDKVLPVLMDLLGDKLEVIG